MNGIGLDLSAPRLSTTAIEYRGRVRYCAPFSAGYQGISFTGKGCFTAGKVTIRANVVGNTVRYSLNVTTTKAGKLNFPGSLKWTNRVI